MQASREDSRPAAVRWTGVALGWVLLLLVLLPPAVQGQGLRYQVNVRGVMMNCTSAFGERVGVILDRSLQDVGMATRAYNGAPVIVINPDVTRRYSNLVAQWWFAHECAHHALPPALNSEPAADCFGVRELVRLGLIVDPRQLAAFGYELANLPGSPLGHLPGPLRARRIAACALT